MGRDSIGLTVLGDTLFACGGYDGNQYVKMVEKYDAEKNEWIQTAPLNCCRAAVCVVTVPNQLTPSASATPSAMPSTATSTNSTV